MRSGEADREALLEQLENLLNIVRGKRFATSFAVFGEQFKPGDKPAGEGEGVESPPRSFRRGDLVRTKSGYLAYVGHYDHRNRVVANVVYEACEFDEPELMIVPR